MAAAVLAAHGAALASGLAAWLDDMHRGSDLLSQNREGLVSVVRYYFGCVLRRNIVHLLA
jgi:hypothetical protein